MAWFGRGTEDLDAARYNREGGHHSQSAFLAQQAAEKALKAVLIAIGLPLRKTHDLVASARQLHAPHGIENACDTLNPHYIEARYPTGLEDKYEAEDAREAIEAAAEVVAWARTRL